MRQQSLIEVGRFTPQDVLPFITEDKKFRKEYIVDGKLYKVKMNSLRYFTFQNSLKCLKCGLEGTIMMLEFFASDLELNNNPTPHFNLYAEKDSELILITKDHIIPVCQGGLDRINNLQTMCVPCNQKNQD